MRLNFIAFFALLGCAWAAATDVPVVNPSFEADVTGSGTFPVLVPQGWAVLDPNGILDGGDDSTGVVNPTGTTFFPAGAPDGNNLGFIFLSQQIEGGEVSLRQILSSTLQANTRYTLTVQVGNIASGSGSNNVFYDLDGFPGYRVELLANGQVLSTDINTLSIPEGECRMATVQFTTGATHPQMGQPLEIRFTNLNQRFSAEDPGIEVDFDDVHLDASPAGPYVLGIQSASPNSGVNMTVWTADTGGLKNGATPFSRTYNAGTNAQVTAPLNVGNQWFDHWDLDGVTVPGGLRTIAVTMGAAHIIKATYLTGRTLTVGSENPASGVPITVWTTDENGLKNGTTEFVRTYTQGTQAAVTAPAVVGTRYFRRWNLDGASWQANKTVTVPMFANRTLTAVYGDGVVLTVQASEASVPITVWTNDRAGLGNGTTTFTRLYAPNQTVSLTAPASAGGKAFVRWEKDGVAQPGPGKTLTLTMDAAHTLRAIYGP
jgi:hypothetical protein